MRFMRALQGLVALTVATAASGATIFQPPPFSSLIETSIRSAAMGGAGAAVTWGEPAAWSNPATLSHVNGLGWVSGHTDGPTTLTFRRPEDVEFSSQRLFIGGGGVGFTLMGEPISGLGEARFDRAPIAFPLGGTGPRPYDLTEGWGVGVSPLRLVESVRKLGKMHPHSYTSFGDVAVGYQDKSSKASNGTSTFDRAGTYDWGVTGKLAVSRLWGEDPPFRMDVSGSYSQINMLKSESKNADASTVQSDRIGAALHLSPAPPSARTASPPSLPWWRPGDVPELSIGLAYDHDRRHGEPFGGAESSVDHYGFEANVFRLLSLRVGYLSDPEADTEGMTYGGGVSLPIGPWGSVGYQVASVPNASGLDRLLRQGWSVWLDPSRIWGDAR
jgi:hypothetical protein